MRVVKTKHLVHIMLFGEVTNNRDVMPPPLFLYGLRGSCAVLDCEGGCWITPRLVTGFGAMPYKQDNPVWVV